MDKPDNVTIMSTYSLEVKVGLVVAPTTTISELQEFTEKIRRLVAGAFQEGTQVIANLKSEVLACG